MEEHMESADEMQEQAVNQEPYKPRPVWQVWAARVGLVIMIIAVALYYYHIARGG